MRGLFFRRQQAEIISSERPGDMSGSPLNLKLQMFITILLLAYSEYGLVSRVISLGPHSCEDATGMSFVGVQEQVCCENV